MIQRAHKTVDVMELSRSIRGKFGNTYDYMLDRVYLLAAVSHLPEALQVQLVQNHGVGACANCGRKIRGRQDWEVVHLCGPVCTIEAANQSCTCCRRLSCSISLDSLCFVCSACEPAALEKHYGGPLFEHFLLLADTAHSTKLSRMRLLRTRIRQKTYLLHALQALHLSELQLLHCLLLRPGSAETCQDCNAALEDDNVYIKFDPDFPPASLVDVEQACRVVCRECRCCHRCSTCRSWLGADTGVVTYRSTNDVLCHVLQCVSCVQQEDVGTLSPMQPVATVRRPLVDWEKPSHPRIFAATHNLAMFRRDVRVLAEDGSDLTEHCIQECFELQRGKCDLCQVMLTIPASTRCLKKPSDFSINRVDNSQPHSRSNVALTCWSCNQRYRTCVQCHRFSLDRCNFVVFQEQTICRPCFKKPFISRHFNSQ
jgi:hypothetical protein